VPKVVDRERRRGDLARAAARVIARVGLEGVTVQAVADESGCSAGSLAHYFRNKDELLVHALRTSTEALLRPLRESAASRGGLEPLRAIARESLPLDAPREREWRVRLAFWSRGSGSPVEVDLARRSFAEWRTLWESAIRSAQQAGAARADVDARRASLGIVAIVVGIAAQLLNRPRAGADQLADAVESYIDSFASSASH
jgi:AcrR family transcriptional regulator